MVGQRGYLVRQVFLAHCEALILLGLQETGRLWAIHYLEDRVEEHGILEVERAVQEHHHQSEIELPLLS